MGALKNAAATVVAMAQTRLALLANDIQVQKLQALRQLGYGLAGVFCLCLGVVLAVLLAVLLWWEHRIWVVGGFTLLFLGLAVGFFSALRSASAKAAPVFAASLTELEEDLRQLKAAAGPKRS